MTANIVGALLLFFGTMTLLFGLSYVNTPQYKLMSIVNEITGGSDPTGYGGVVIGGIVAFIGLITLFVSVSRNKKV